ncbi:putative DNA polymerase III beta subunit [Microcystis phage Me-ZS1]|nr:putative DNA polymerase III beta subunit [Microcystis phage Me-ZS1]
MLEQLRFVQGAVARKDYVPELTHFRIHNGTVKGQNGTIALCAPLNVGLDANPKAVPFVKALQACRDTVELHMTPAGRLSVRSGNFRAFVDCLPPGEYHDVSPEGDIVTLPPHFNTALKTLAPYIAEDASRQWALGILIRGQCAYATNNVVLVEHWLGGDFGHTINIPKAAVAEVLRIGKVPVSVQCADTNATFHFEDGSWLRTQLYSTDWPDLSKILDRPSKQEAVNPGLFDAIARVLPFADDAGRVYVNPGRVTTTTAENEGATVEVGDLEAVAGVYNAAQLLGIKPIAETIDFTQYPAPCSFTGPLLRGAIIGMRQ